MRQITVGSEGYPDHSIAFGNSLDHLERFEVLHPHSLAGAGVAHRPARGANFDSPGVGGQGHGLTPMNKECSRERIGSQRGAFRQSAPREPALQILGAREEGRGEAGEYPLLRRDVSCLLGFVAGQRAPQHEHRELAANFHRNIERPAGALRACHAHQCPRL